MTDQIQVTDDDRRRAHEWAVTHRAPTVSGEAHAAARVILATVPVPPKSLADELREWAGELPAPDTEPDPWVTFDAIVKHAEAVDAENERLRADAEERQAWNQKITDENATLTRERAEARNELDKLKFETLEGLTTRGWMRARKAAEQEVERLRKELGEERGKVHESSQLEDEAVSLSYWLADNLGEHVDDQDNETLTATVRRFVKQETARLVRERDEFRGEMISSEKRQARLESALPAPEDEFEDPLSGPIASWMDGYVTATIFEAGKPPLVEVNYLPAPDPDAFAAAIKAAGRYTKAGIDE